jgi:hypothetical protein
MQILGTNELERLVRETFPAKPQFSAEAELGVDPHRRPIVTFVHGGADPFLDRQFEDWLTGAPVFVAAHQVLNQLCRAGALAPGQYALTRPDESRADRRGAQPTSAPSERSHQSVGGSRDLHDLQVNR